MTSFAQGLRTDSPVRSAGCVITHLSVLNTRRLVLKVTCRNKMMETLWLSNTIFPSFLWFLCEVSCTYFSAMPSSEQYRYSWTKNATLLFSLQWYAMPQHPFQCWETVSCRRRWTTCRYSMKRKNHNAHYSGCRNGGQAFQVKEPTVSWHRCTWEIFLLWKLHRFP